MRKCVVYSLVAVVAICALLGIRHFFFHSAVLHKDYSARVSSDYIIMYPRAMAPDPYVVLDLGRKTVAIYSVHREEGLIATRPLTDANLIWISSFTETGRIFEIPKSNGVFLMDAFQFAARGELGGRSFEFDHTLPKDSMVLELHRMYEYFIRSTPRKKRPNQAMQTTPRAVTCCACAQPAPARSVSDLGRSAKTE